MESEHADDGKAEKKTRVSTREMTTPLFLLRCVQMGIALRDLDLLTVGMVNDMAIERENDDYKWPLKATQADIDKFFGCGEDYETLQERRAASSETVRHSRLLAFCVYRSYQHNLDSDISSEIVATIAP